MTHESKEFVELREGEYARARSQCPPEVVIEPDEPNTVCRCCGERKRIKPMMHVCMECFEEER
jgi:hypothetical protein